MRGRAPLGLSRRDVWSLSILMTVSVLVGGRSVEIALDEWPFYREHASLMPAFWLGGMATHGLLIGAAAATACTRSCGANRSCSSRTRSSFRGRS